MRLGHFYPCPLPKPVHAQFGIDLAAILAALEKMQSMMSSYIAAPCGHPEDSRASRTTSIR